MNIVAIDIGNTNITFALYVDDSEKMLDTFAGDDSQKIQAWLKEAWEQVPFVKGAKVKKREGVIVVSSVNDQWCEAIKSICKDKLGEKIKIVGKDVSLPIETSLEDNMAVGTDRLVSAAAAFAVVEDAVAIGDFGTAATIDLVDDQGVFQGGVIAPGMKMGAAALKAGTSKLPEIAPAKPKGALGANTEDSITAGLFYGALGLFRTVTEKFAEEIGKWPYTIISGGDAETLKDQCDFIDACVPNLAVKGIVLAYKKHLDDQTLIEELDTGDNKK